MNKNNESVQKYTYNPYAYLQAGSSTIAVFESSAPFGAVLEGPDRRVSGGAHRGIDNKDEQQP